MDTAADIAAVVVAAMTVIVGAATLWVIPSFKRRLNASEFLVGELSELVNISAYDPETTVAMEHQLPVPALLRDIRAGRHDPVFDRVVFEFVRGVPGYTITPLKGEDLKKEEVQGIWGLSIKMRSCNVRRSDGPDADHLAVEHPKRYIGLPAVSDYRLVNEDNGTCEWVIGAPQQTRYRAFELDEPPRLVLDFFRQRSA